VIAVYPKESEFPVLCEDCFWSDKWDPSEYGRDFDFGRPFFEQFRELAVIVPRIAITRAKCINSDYALNCIENKNCYLTSGADYNEDCMYGINTQRSKSCIDHYLIYDSELCYGCIDSTRLYNCVSCQDCADCSDSWFLYDSKGCNHCAFSSNLRNKSYVLFNKQLSKEEYDRQIEEIISRIMEDPDWIYKNMVKVRSKAIHRHALVLNTENSSGHVVRNCKNARYVFDAEDLEDCKYIFYGLDAKDSYDCSCLGFECRLNYELTSACNAYNCSFSVSSLYNHNASYTVSCFNCEYIFGCISLRNHQKYQILNKQYSKEDYEKLRERIVEHMSETGEWGEFFPMNLSPFEYNRSMANDHMPLEREAALELGAKWFDGEQEHGSSDESVKCVDCHNDYLLVSQELRFYDRMKLPRPKLCWACRLKRLINSRERRVLFDRDCSKCSTNVKSPIDQTRMEAVYCQDCYREAVY